MPYDVSAYFERLERIRSQALFYEKSDPIVAEHIKHIMETAKIPVPKGRDPVFRDLCEQYKDMLWRGLFGYVEIREPILGAVNAYDVMSWENDPTGHGLYSKISDPECPLKECLPLLREKDAVLRWIACGGGVRPESRSVLRKTHPEEQLLELDRDLGSLLHKLLIIHCRDTRKNFSRFSKNNGKKITWEQDKPRRKN